MTERTARIEDYVQVDDLSGVVDDALQAVERIIVEGVARTGVAR